MYMAGSSLNIVTVTIATISLGVGIDYCIHVTERYREGRESGETHKEALIGIGGACGLALVGSAASDIAGFSVIALSPMGLFSNFGIFSAAMIGFSLVASLVLTTAALGLVARASNVGAQDDGNPTA
jgi:predicted RND superfamily exporter protein